MFIENRASCRQERFATGASITLNTVGRQAVLPKLVRIAKWTFRWHERIDQLRLATVAQLRVTMGIMLLNLVFNERLCLRQVVLSYPYGYLTRFTFSAAVHALLHTMRCMVLV